MGSYIENWTNCLNYFGELIAYLASEIDGLPKNEADALINEYRDRISYNYPVIFESAATELKFYMSFYDVRPMGGTPDELKIFYFLGKAIAEEFEDKGLSTLQKYQLKAIQRIFNIRLAEVDAYRVSLSERIDTAIDHGAITTIKKDFGRFGWYVVHRCLLNASTEKKK